MINDQWILGRDPNQYPIARPPNAPIHSYTGVGFSPVVSGTISNPAITIPNASPPPLAAASPRRPSPPSCLAAASPRRPLAAQKPAPTTQPKIQSVLIS